MGEVLTIAKRSNKKSVQKEERLEEYKICNQEEENMDKKAKDQLKA